MVSLTYLGVNRGDALREGGVIEDRFVGLNVSCDDGIGYKGGLTFAQRRLTHAELIRVLGAV